MPDDIGDSTPAITGDEDLGSGSETRQALARFYRAFNQRDLELMADNWDQTADAAMSNPLGGIMRGWPAIRAVYERIFSSPAAVRVAFTDYSIHVVGDVFYAVGRERGTFARLGTTLGLRIRTSRIFRRDPEGRWRQTHHHGSFDDPELLAAYQRAVAGS